MFKSSVLKIIQTFSKEELEKFEDFLKSPYHNKKSGVVKLFIEIKQYYPDFTDENLDKEKVWARLYPGKEFGYGVMKNLIFDLSKLSEEFIAHQLYRKRELQEQALILKALSERNLKSLIDSKFSFIDKHFGEELIKDLKNLDIMEYFSLHSRILETKMWNTQFYNQHISIEKNIASYQTSILTGIFINLITGYYLIFSCSLNDKGSFNSKNTIGMLLKNIPDSLIQNILTKIREESEKKYIILNCYYLGYKASVNLDDSSYFMKFKNYVRKNAGELPYYSLIDIDVLLMNSASLMSEKDFDRNKAVYELIRFKLDHNIILDRNGLIMSASFLVIVKFIFEDGKYEELENFITRYGIFLKDIESEGALQFAEALLLQLKARFSESLEQFSKIKFTSTLLKEGMKKATMLAYFELDDYNLFLSALDSFKHYLDYSDWGGDELRQFRQDKALLFCNYLNRLFKSKVEKNMYEIDLIEQDIMRINIDYKNWFLRKIEDIKKGERKRTA